MKIKKAIIPAAGLGTRMLPATKAMPKEMIPIVDKPAIQYIVEEAAESGITDILIIISDEKSIIEEHFSKSPELEKKLKAGGESKKELLNEVIGIANLANITYIKQREQKGLGHAVLQAKDFVGNEPFVILYGDDVIIGEDPCTAQLCRAYEKYGKGVVGINKVSRDDIHRYSSMELSFMCENIYKITDMIEKPTKGKEYSLFSILGRCILSPEIFDILKHTPYGFGNELQLTDAMREIAIKDGLIGVDFTGKRYDMGDKLGILQASIEVGLKNREFGNEFKGYLKELVKTF